MTLSISMPCIYCFFCLIQFLFTLLLGTAPYDCFESKCLATLVEFVVAFLQTNIKQINTFELLLTKTAWPIRL